MAKHFALLLLRRNRLILIAAQGAVAAVLVCLLASNAVAFAMVLAPNAIGLSRGTPSGVTLPGLHERFVRVGAQPVTLAVATLEPASQPARGTVVLLHGLRMDRRSLSGMASAVSDAGYRAVLVDLRGHGASTGRYLTYGQEEAKDVQRVLDELARDDGDLGPVAVLGFSYGAAVALDVAALDARVKTAVAISPFSSLREVVRDYQAHYLRGPLRWLPDAWFQAALDDAGRISCFDPDRVGPEASIARGSASLLLIHGDADRQVELRHSRRLESLAGRRARLFVVPGATHDSVLSHSSVRHQALAWLAERL